ncbi:FitA-like ribbon-helix-helix domain-containing protein [Candidatus Poriferisodalis sp.]|uniref:FitA-like ribbon-helix-helix domain-containing protein n=1 Tax=Candidatus Poriferisodalis sp. TaxID=3101277 RepID=UPI003B019390
MRAASSGCSMEEEARRILRAVLEADAAANGMAVVTRNEADFAGVGVDIINPWMND